MEGVWGESPAYSGLGVWVFGEALLARVRGGGEVRRGVGLGWVGTPAKVRGFPSNPLPAGVCEQNPRAQGGGRGCRPYLVPHL